MSIISDHSKLYYNGLINMKNIILLLIILQSLASAIQSVTLQLHWKHQFQYAGFYAAIEQGYYNDLGIEVKIKEWNQNINKIQDLRNQKADIIIGASDILGEVFKSDDLLLISAYLQKTPVALAVKPDIYFPSDLKDKRIMAANNDLESSSFYKMWQSSNINPKKLNLEPHTFSMDSFVNGKVDGIQIYITDQLFELAEQKIQFNILSANNYGIDFYDIISISTKQFAAKNSKLIQNFKEATNKGWEYALNHKEELTELIIKKYNSQNKSKEALLFEAKRLENFILPKQYTLGNLEQNKLNKIALIHFEMGNILKIDNIDKYIFSYDNFDKNLNLTEIEKKYLQEKETLNICSIPNNISIVDKKFYKSIDIKIIEEITKKLQVNYKLINTKSYAESELYTKNGICDILSITRKTLDRDKILNINKPYIAQPLVMVTNSDVLFIDNFSKLKNKTIAISNDYTAFKMIKKLYPNLNIIEVQDPQTGLELVKKKQIFGFVDIPIIISHHIKQTGYLDLKIVGNLNINSGISMATTKKEPLLAPILEKSMNIISEDYITTLINEWYAIKYEKGIDYTLLWQTIVFALLLLSAMFYWNRKIQHTNSLLEVAHEELEEKNHILEKISVTDRLTNLFNRHKIDEVLNEEKSRCDRYSDTFGIIMLDIDHFKSVNDTYGHQVGDIVLKEISNILKSNIRSTDILGRWGGEEFLIICVNSDLEATKVVAEKCRKAIENFNFTTVQHKTSSFGISIYNKNQTIKETITKADDNLYKAKETGRNKIVF